MKMRNCSIFFSSVMHIQSFNRIDQLTKITYLPKSRGCGNFDPSPIWREGGGVNVIQFFLSPLSKKNQYSWEYNINVNNIKK